VARFGMPELLLVLAVLVAMVGVSRLVSREAHSSQDTRHALIVWLALLAGGVSVWLLAAFHIW
jgi:hypothetical protein